MRNKGRRQEKETTRESHTTPHSTFHLHRAIGTYQDLGSFYIGAGFKTFMAVIIYAKIFLGATSEFTLTVSQQLFHTQHVMQYIRHMSKPLSHTQTQLHT